MAYAYSVSQPAKGILVAQTAAELAQKIGDNNGLMKALRFMANSYNNQGDYNKALEIFLKQLALSEKSKNWHDMASSLMNIGIIYTQQADYNKALPYYLQSDSIIKQNQLKDLAYFSFQNLGDLYDRINQNDAAFENYTKAFQKATQLGDGYLIGASNIGLGNCLVKKGDYEKGKAAYQLALIQLKEAKDDDLYCEAVMNLAKLYIKTNESKAALHMAWQIPLFAGKDKLPSRIKDQTAFLSDYYKSIQQNDSALYYLEQFNLISETINSQEKVKHFQEKTFQESLRQETLVEEKKKLEEERSKQLQHMAWQIPLFAGKDKFPSRIKDQTAFLSDYYKSIQQNDSALYYLEQFNLISETINSQEKVKHFQEKTFQESLRQETLVEEKKKLEEERSKQLQLLLIGIFIPLFFLITLFLSKRKVPAKMIKTLGIISLLLFFEYLTLLLHPVVADFTHHTPVLELLIFVCIAALLIPTHHRVEHWLLEKLTNAHAKPKEPSLKIKQSKLKIKSPENRNE